MKAALASSKFRIGIVTHVMFALAYFLAFFHVVQNSTNTSGALVLSSVLLMLMFAHVLQRQSILTLSGAVAGCISLASLFAIYLSVSSPTGFEPELRTPLKKLIVVFFLSLIAAWLAHTSIKWRMMIKAKDSQFSF